MIIKQRGRLRTVVALARRQKFLTLGIIGTKALYLCLRTYFHFPLRTKLLHGGGTFAGGGAMHEKSDAVIFVGCGYPMGGVLFMAHMGCAIYKASYGRAFDYYFASISEEAQKGYWELVHSQMDDSVIIEAGTFSELTVRIAELARRYNRVIIHTGGGYGQTKHFIRMRHRVGKTLARRIFFVGTTHSYRHDSILRIPMSAFQYVLYRLYYRMIVFQCQYAADRFVGGRDLIRRGMGVVVPLGCEEFDKIDETAPEGIAANAELSTALYDNKLFKFVYLAAFRPGKMHAWLVSAIAPVLRRHPETRIFLCGTGAQKVVDKVMAVIRNNGLESQIILPGKISRAEIPWLLAHCNCALVPSRAETFGHNFLEPMFAGLPVLGTRVGIGRDIIQDGETGYGFDLSNVSILQSAAEKLLSDHEAARELGRNAKAVVEKEFTHAAVARRLVQVYEDVLFGGGIVDEKCAIGRGVTEL